MVEVSNTNQLDITQKWCPWNEYGTILEQAESLGNDNSSNLPADVDLARPLPSPLPDCLGNYGSLPDYQGSGLFNKGCGFAGDFYLLQDLSSTEEEGDDGSTENVFFDENDDDGLVMDDDDGDKDKGVDCSGNLTVEGGESSSSFESNADGLNFDISFDGLEIHAEVTYSESNTSEPSDRGDGPGSGDHK